MAIKYDIFVFENAYLMSYFVYLGKIYDYKVKIEHL